ncbi:PREDICTED: BTB/POZ domain-containing protein 17-like [Branchiostoma belcheri]|uniref:BTB/POZ domain-containing protein 17-like n=1 Tax=Branchiostoma belcheri TaxID=7741 RepID=A0A6P4YZT2_BRABE|nr:PREDICTED: BTB/POZ domain-containing protein 17-like [Branchiostoma belcheri]XP_019624327.1 PREDICTED: BTB/POZ domain-containing protein 17-like [Branchiostoma belcheri]
MTAKNSPEAIVGDLRDFSRSFSALFNNPEMSDVVLVVGEQRFHAHKLILTSQSDVFRTMLTSSLWDVARQPEVQLHESAECERVFQNFLRFFYQGQVNCTLETAMPLLLLADKYNVNALKVACDNFMTTQLGRGEFAPALQWLPYSIAFRLESLRVKCVDIIVPNMSLVLNSNTWLQLPLDCIVHILQSSRLAVENEYMIFEAVMKWVQQEARRHQMQDLLSSIVPEVRFSQMTAGHLWLVEQICVRYGSNGKLMAGLQEAHRYRSLVAFAEEEGRDKLELSQSFSDRRFFPREYTASSGEAWAWLDWSLPCPGAPDYAALNPTQPAGYRKQKFMSNSHLTRVGQWQVTFIAQRDGSLSASMYCTQNRTIRPTLMRFVVCDKQGEPSYIIHKVSAVDVTVANVVSGEKAREIVNEEGKLRIGVFVRDLE